MPKQLLACSNCDQAAADRYWWLTGAIILIALLAVVLLLVRLRHTVGKRRAFGLFAALVLAAGVGLSLSTLTAHIRTEANGMPVICSSALTSAETTGLAGTRELDPAQLSCRAAARKHLRAGLPLGIAVVAVGFLATIAVGAEVSFRRIPTPVTSPS